MGLPSSLSVLRHVRIHMIIYWGGAKKFIKTEKILSYER